MKYETLSKDGLKCPLCDSAMKEIARYKTHDAYKCLTCGKGWHVKND